MPKTSQMLPSKYLKQADVGRGVLLTIVGCTQVDVSEDEGKELKWALVFQETPKPLVLNSTNIQLCEQMFGSDDSDHWLGRQLVAYTDPTVSFGGKVVGGIRVRAPRIVGHAAVKTAPVPAPQPEGLTRGDYQGVLAQTRSVIDDDDIPF